VGFDGVVAALECSDPEGLLGVLGEPGVVSVLLVLQVGELVASERDLGVEAVDSRTDDAGPRLLGGSDLGLGVS
jgi:hypothetical protein